MQKNFLMLSLLLLCFSPVSGADKTSKKMLLSETQIYTDSPYNARGEKRDKREEDTLHNVVENVYVRLNTAYDRVEQLQQSVDSQETEHDKLVERVKTLEQNWDNTEVAKRLTDLETKDVTTEAGSSSRTSREVSQVQSILVQTSHDVHGKPLEKVQQVPLHTALTTLGSRVELLEKKYDGLSKVKIHYGQTGKLLDNTREVSLQEFATLTEERYAPAKHSLDKAPRSKNVTLSFKERVSSAVAWAWTANMLPVGSVASAVGTKIVTSPGIAWLWSKGILLIPVIAKTYGAKAAAGIMTASGVAATYGVPVILAGLVAHAGYKGLYKGKDGLKNYHTKRMDKYVTKEKLKHEVAKEKNAQIAAFDEKAVKDSVSPWRSTVNYPVVLLKKSLYDVYGKIIAEQLRKFQNLQ